MSCRARTANFETVEQAIAAWNRRAEDERYKNALKEIIKLACESVEREKTLARLEAEVMAAIDAAPVVRCSECRFRNTSWYDKRDMLESFCRWDRDESPNDNDYCSYGERRK